ncbi:MAG TPA: phosphoesterase [Planctomycetes bacterium]|nr:phosphoesterase [Planctomycetota bacterium]
MEFVYVVPREKLFRDCYPQGLVSFADEAERRALEDCIRTEGFFCERDYAERTPSLKQVIPYTVFQAGEEVLLMRRLAKSGESRLHGKLSLGVGGHINPEDIASADRCDPIADGTRREIEEEILVQGSYELETVGFLNDDSNPVGAVHVGIVQIAHVEGSIEIREKQVLEGSLVSLPSLHERFEAGDTFETWSSILIQDLPALSLAHACT